MNGDTMPRGWVWARLGEVGELLRGVSYAKHDASKEPKEGYLPILRATNINTELNFEDLVYVPSHKIEKEQLLQALDILIAMSSGSKDLVGKAAQAKDNFQGGFGAFCGLIRINDNLNKKFGGFFFQCHDYRREISQLSSGVNINNLRREHIESLKLPLPPLHEQHRIVAKIEELFTKLDAGVEALKKAKAQLKRYRQSVLKVACEGKLVPTEAELAHTEGRDYEPAEVLLARILKERREKSKGAKYKEPKAPDTNGLPGLPRGWIWARFEQTVSLSQNGFGKRSSEEGNPTIVLRLADIINGEISLNNVRRIRATNGELEKYKLLNNDILCIRVNGSRNLVGRMIRYKSVPEPITFCDHFIRFQLMEPTMAPFLSMYFDTERVRKYVEINTVSSAGQNTVSQVTIMAIPIPLPPFAEQRRIVFEVERYLSIADEVEKTVEQSLRQAERLRQSILKRAFEGKLVPQDPSDEPADRLLERIKTEKARQGTRKKARGRRKLNAPMERVLI